VPLCERVPLERGRQSAAIGSYSVKTVADRYRLVYRNIITSFIITALVTGFLDLSTSMTVNDLEPTKIFHNFWMQRTIATKWLEIDQDNMHMKFSALNVDFSSPSPDPLRSRRPAQASVKDGYPLKSGYLTAIGSCSAKTVADMQRHAAHHNNQ